MFGGPAPAEGDIAFSFKAINDDELFQYGRVFELCL